MSVEEDEGVVSAFQFCAPIHFSAPALLHQPPPTVEGKLATAFDEQSVRYCKAAPSSSAPPRYRYIAFDFHAECGAKQYHRISVLWDQVWGHVRVPDLPYGHNSMGCHKNMDSSSGTAPCIPSFAGNSPMYPIICWRRQGAQVSMAPQQR